MDSSTYSYTDTPSSYGTRITTTFVPPQLGARRRADHYDLFLLIQDMLRTDRSAILEFPSDNFGREGEWNFGIGAGGFSSVSRKIAKTRWGKRSVMAYKRLRPVFDSDGKIDDAAALEQFVDELGVLSVPDVRCHPNINRLRGVAFETQPHRLDGSLFPVMISDPSSLGNLLSFIRDPVRMAEGPYWEFCDDVARGLQVLHKNNFIHGDVKCENVLVFPCRRVQERSFVAKLTDFGCSITLDAIEVGAYTRLRGASPPYDAPESDSMIQRDLLPATDMYSYGLLVWRVATDGADPFKHARYRASEGEGVLGRIREDKRTETTLSMALEAIYDPDLGLDSDTANSVGELLTVALASDPTERDIERILEVFGRGNVMLERRCFGLTAANGRYLRKYMAQEARLVRHLTQVGFGLAVWNKMPPKAHHYYHITHKLGEFNADFRGFGVSRLPPTAESLREALLAIENVYLSCGKPIPSVADSGPTPPAGSDAMLSVSAVDNLVAGCHNALAVASTCDSLQEFDRLVDALQSAIHKFRRTCRSMGELLRAVADPTRELSDEPSDLEQSSHAHTSLYDRPGGLGDADATLMTHEDLPNPSPGYGRSSTLDFHLLSTCRVPDTLRKQLWKDILARAPSEDPSGGVTSIERAICHGAGFGTEQSYLECLAILQQQCDRASQPAQNAVVSIYEALGFQIPENVTAAEWYKRRHACSSDSASATASRDQIVRGLGNLDLAHAPVDDDFALLAACRLGNLSVLHAILADSPDCSHRNRLGESVLHWIWKLDPVSIDTLLPRLVRRGADINATAYENPSFASHSYFPMVPGTALHRAVAQKNQAAVSALLRHGAAMDQEVGPVFFHNGQTRRMDPVQLACTWHDVGIVETLLDANPWYPLNADETGRVGLLYFAIQCQNIVLRMARHGSNHYTAMAATLELLIRRGCTTDVDSTGLTALQLAVEAQPSDVLEYIIADGTLVSDVNELVGGKSALHRAIALGDREKFDLLLEHGANVMQAPTSGSILDFAVQVAPGHDYFVKRIVEIGGDRVTERDKNCALKPALMEGQWGLADYLLGIGSSINGYTTLESSVSAPQSTVFGDLLNIDSVTAELQILERILPLAEKHGQQPRFMVTPSYRRSALHAAAAQLFVHQKAEATRIYTVLLDIFPGKHHLEARNLQGWTPLQSAISFRNAVAVQLLIDAGADVNAMSLIEHTPAGPSTKDLVFAQLFSREQVYRLDIETRDEADRALEQIIAIYRTDPRARLAKRSTTLRAEQRLAAPPRDRRVMDFVQVLSLLPWQLPHRGHEIAANYIEAVAAGDARQRARQGVEEVAGGPQGVARLVQWSGIECVRILRNQGRKRLEMLGLWEDYANE
ncbi:uncharacterized protein BDW70DRAFT_119529 [Aspergillus foveolatus]|uniref:uncharacterized protein n=1 Tax=Aspergillus foveolatus TaxID=210207 RepID=UPI003CCE0C38